MTNLKEIYKCDICGNIVEVLQTGQGELVCCGQPMNLIEEKKHDAEFEKHTPVLEKENNNVTVTVGEDPHPMEEDHFIEWIEIVSQNGNSCKHFLKPSDEAKAEFIVNAETIKVRAYCNIHGLWSNI